MGRRTRPLPISQHSRAHTRQFIIRLVYIPTTSTFTCDLIRTFPTSYIRFLTFRLQAFAVAMPPACGHRQLAYRRILPSEIVRSIYNSRDDVRERRASTSRTASTDKGSSTSSGVSKRASHARTFASPIYTFTNATGRIEHFRIPPRRTTVPRSDFDYSELGRRRPNGASRPASSPPQRGSPHIIRRL